MAPASSAGPGTGPIPGPSLRNAAVTAPADLADLRVLRRLMLALIAAGDGPPAAALVGLSAADWHALDDMAWQHRLQPLLHARRGLGSDKVQTNKVRNPIPPAILDRWSAAYRTAGIRALKARAELAETTARLEAAGFAPIALKGAWLAWHAYPHPALRPLRDLDLLLTPDTVIPAFRHLVAQGYTPPEAQEFLLEDAVRLDKHMPPLTSPRGITIELHQRLWEIDGRMDHAAPRANETPIRARAIRIGSITYPHAADMLAHLVIHAVYDHRLDCGPLLLPDIACLLRTQETQAAPIEWAPFWAQAAAQGWREGAGLVLELVRAHDPEVAIEVPADAAPPPAVIDAAADLLLQNLFTRASAGVVATMAARGPAAFWRRVTARRSDPHDDGSKVSSDPVARNLSGEGGFVQWAVTRLRRTIGQLARPDVRQQSRDLAALSKWLDARR